MDHRVLKQEEGVLRRVKSGMLCALRKLLLDALGCELLPPF